MEETLRAAGDREAYFWSAQSGAELDLLVFHGGKRFGFEFKYADAPAVTKSLQTARGDLRLERAFIVSPGARSYPLDDWVEVVGIGTLRARLAKLMPEVRRSARSPARKRG